MKIKKLIIRNIASIEQGEIDFENGLIDRETGRPSSLFLITGDTGSGKSVILDCISMTLYGTTPRVKGVNDTTKNKFRNNIGQEISVNDISQYTRIGITSKDQCYAELFFTGNDDIDYVSRFALGINNQKKLRKPTWTLKAGDSEIIEGRKEEIKERIQKAVGLTFEQFSRMSMLAQGQFAEFLTGKKGEREIILEQLTATDIFSRYGEAITDLYKEAKQQKETASSIFEEFSKKILSEGKREELIAEQSEKQSIASGYKEKTEKLRHRIGFTEAVIQAEKEIIRLNTIADELKKYEETPEFRKRVEILDLWDSTAPQRELLSDRLKASDKLQSDRIILKGKKAQLLYLTDDLSARIEAATVQSQRIDHLRLWIEDHEPLKNLYTDSTAIIAEIRRFVATVKEIRRKEQESKEVKNIIKELEKTLSHLDKTVKEKSKLCIKIQDHISQKRKERDELNPTSLRKENERLVKRQFTLKELTQRLENADAERLEKEKAEKNIVEMANSLSELKADADKKSEVCARAEKEKNVAENRYRTMLLSVEKNFEALRRQLVEDHASNCPLCGQSIVSHIHEWSKEDYFSGILSPLEKEKNTLREAYIIAKKDTDESMKKMSITTGNLKAKEEELKQRNLTLKNIEDKINEIVRSLELESTDNLIEGITDEISSLKNEIDVISKKISLSDTLQKEIDTLIKEKELLDQDQKCEEKKLQTALQSLAQKKESLRLAYERTAELMNEKQTLHMNISIALKDFDDQWEADPSETVLRLKKDAEKYVDNISKYSKEAPAHRSHLNILKAISETRTSLSCLLSSVEAAETGFNFGNQKTMSIDTVQTKWQDFYVEVSTICNRITETETKIKELNQDLNGYYQESGTSEVTLHHLLKASTEINQMRIQQEIHRDNIRRNSTLLSEAVKIKDENLKKLNLKDLTQLEDSDKLSSELNMYENLYSELTQRLGAIKEKLEADEKTKLESERQRADLVQKTLLFEKWEKMNRYFGSTRFRTLVQSHILRPLLNNANIYLRQITDHYTLTCSDENEQLSILVLDRYHNNEPRSVTVLSGGERFMISLALSLALSAMNRPDLNVDILFIDEGFGTLDAKSLEMVMSTLRRLPDINGQTGRRVGVISHREELTEQIPTQIQLHHCGEGRSRIVISNS